MDSEKGAILRKYIICFGVASLITVAVFGIRGFFTEDLGSNLQILSDGFSTSGILLLLFSGLIFISGEGGLLGIGFILQYVVKVFVPMGRRNHETYAQYRERKLGKERSRGDASLPIVGLLFLLTGVILTAVWYVNFYNV